MKRMILVCWLCLAATFAYAEGDWIADKRTGCKVSWDTKLKGSVTWSGECKNGKAAGKGTLEFYRDEKLFSSIKGEMKDGLCIRDCSYENIIGIKYVGEFKDGNKESNGTMIWPDGGVYSGEWKDGYKHGLGKLTYPAKTKKNYAEYAGEWKDGRRHGEGTMIYQNGDKYSGGWSEGKPHGKGTYTFKDGTSYEGLWERGERIKIF